jgi:hypothetical protein
VSFKELSSNITQYLANRRKDISDNPRSVNYILLKLDQYVDIIYRELQESFPLADTGVIQQIENSLTRPRQREIEQMETSVSIKNKLVRIANELENELREFERKNNNIYSYGIYDFITYNNNTVGIMKRESDFLFNGTCLNSMIDEINDENRRLQRTGSTQSIRNLRRIYQFFKSERVISDIKAKAEREFFTKIDEIIAEYQKYLSEFLRMYEEKWAVKVQAKEAPEFVSVPQEVEVPVTTQEMPIIEEMSPSQQSDSGLDIDYLFPKELEGIEDISEESVGLEEVKQNPRHVTKLTVTYDNGKTKEFSLSTDQEELQGELERLLLKI